jgi:hypothetical protein
MRLGAIASLLVAGCGGIAVVDDGPGNNDGQSPATDPSDSDAFDPNPGGPGSGMDPPPDPVPPPEGCGLGSGVDLSGIWSGTWKSYGQSSGTWTTTWSQQPDGSLAGTSAVTGTDCGTDADVKGTVDDECNVAFGLVGFGGCDVTYSGIVHESGDVMSGTFVLVAGGSDSGLWQGERQ